MSSDDFGGFFDGFVGVLFFFGDMASLVVGSGWKFVESAKGLKLEVGGCWSAIVGPVQVVTG